jgi:hypothetical protein
LLYSENLSKTEPPGNLSKTELPGNLSKTEHPGNQSKTELPGNLSKTEHPGNQSKTEPPGNQSKTEPPGNQLLFYLNLLGTRFCFQNTQVLSLYRLNQEKITYFGTLFKVQEFI